MITCNVIVIDYVVILLIQLIIEQVASNPNHNRLYTYCNHPMSLEYPLTVIMSTIIKNVPIIMELLC